MSTDNPYRSPAYDDFGYLEGELGPREAFSVIDLLFSFQGRVSRLAYWLINIVGTIAYLAVAMLTFSLMGLENHLAGPVAMILYLPFGVSMFAAQIKRWHDRNKSGWWCLVNMVPLIGPLWVFIECGCLPGSEGTNEYGDPPAC